MCYFLVNVAQRWEAKLWQMTAFQSIKTALHQSLPIIIIDIYLRLSVKLILSPNALFVKLFKLDVQPVKPFFDTIMVLLPLADATVVLIYVIALTHQYLTANHYQNTSLPLITNCLAVFLFFGDKNQFPVFNVNQYFVVTLIALLSSYSYTRYAIHIKHHPNPYSLPYLIWAGIIIILGLFLHQLFRQQLFEFFLSDLWTHRFFASFLGLIIITTVAPILYLLGVALPPELTAPSSNMYGVDRNLTTYLTTAHGALPVPENVYSVYGAFTLFGGIGNALAICLVLLYAASKQQRRLARISWFPTLFDNSYLLFVGVPLFLNPLIFIPMILVNLMSLAISFIAITTHFIQPIGFVAPDSLPNLLLPTVASTTPIRSLVITVIILIGSVLLYRPFLSHLTLEVSGEK